MPVDIEKLKKFWDQNADRAVRLGLAGKRDGLNYFTIKDPGEYEVRVITLGRFLTGSHWGILNGVDGRNGGSIKCPRVFEDARCPVCELVEQMYNSESPKDQEQAEEWKVQVKYPILLVDLNERSDKPVPRIYEAPKTVYQGIVKWIQNPRYKDVTDFETGRNLFIIKNVDRKKTSYEVQPDPTPSAFEIDESILPDLEEVLRPKSFADIEYALINGEYPPQEEKEANQKRAAEAVEKLASLRNAPEENESDPEEREPAPVRKPTPYGKGLPATKTKDEDRVVPSTRPLATPLPRSARPAPVEQSAEVPVKEAPAANSMKIGSAVAERLKNLRMQKGAK